MTAADVVASLLAEQGCAHAFGIIGAGNVTLFDAVARLGKTTIIPVHHEQAAAMAANAYFRVGGVVTCAIVTTGAGSSNALTGVMSAFMDSIPLVVIAGNEAKTRMHPRLRAYGVQGYDSVAVAEKMTKWAVRVKQPLAVEMAIRHAFHIATDGRPGPCWVEIPMDTAAAEVPVAA